MKKLIQLAPACAILVLLLCAGLVSDGQTISGHLRVCRGASRTTLTISAVGGAWSSDNTAIATIDAGTGEVTGVATGTATISYTILPATVFTAVVTVSPYVMSAIGFSSGSAMRCTGSYPATCTVSPMSGNNWTSSDVTIATVNTGGLVMPNATNTGTTIISYRHGAGSCYVTREVTVSATPTVSAATTMCNATTQTVTALPAGGTWTSSNTGVGTINGTTGVLTAVSGGVTNINYTSPDGCLRPTNVTVAALPAGITGTLTTCVGNSTTLGSSTSGGSWASSNTLVATVGSSTGVVTGLSAGTATITYAVGSGCIRTSVVTVNATLPANTGGDVVCVGQTITVANAAGGGTWSSSNTSKATVNSSGIVTGISSGTANISYRVGAGCFSITALTVGSMTASITGGPDVCEDAELLLTYPVGGGTWSASNGNVTVDAASGTVTGVTAGSVMATYMLGVGCYKSKSLIIRAKPASITGVTAVCPGSTIALISATGGGTWASSATAVATINPTSGVLTGVSSGTANITYTSGTTGCYTTTVVTVSAGSAGVISGAAVLDLGASTTLTSTMAGGTWSSSDPSVAAISSTGVVTGVSEGSATMTYLLTSDCGTAFSTWPMTILFVPDSTYRPRAWATYVGGDSTETLRAISVDADGFIYIAGSTTSATGMSTPGTHQAANGGARDGYIAKYTSAGMLVWSTYFGGSGHDIVYRMILGADGNLYVAGLTESTSGIATSGADRTVMEGEFDGFLAKFNSGGMRVWATYVGDTGYDEILSLAQDLSGDIFVCGSLQNPTVFATGGTHQSVPGGDYDAFLAKYDSAGNKIWATYYGGAGFDYGFSVGTDLDDNVYMLGQTTSDTGISTAGSHQPERGDTVLWDAFLVKFDNDGVRQWSTYYGGGGAEWGTMLAVCPNSDVCIVGHTTSSDNIATPGAHQSTHVADVDGYVARFDSVGARLWGAYVGGEEPDFLDNIAVDADGYVYTAGMTYSSMNFATPNAFDTTLGGTLKWDGYFNKFSPGGGLLWNTYYGGPHNEDIKALWVDADKNVYLGGYTWSTTEMTTCGTQQPDFLAGIDEAYLVKFSECTGAPSAGTITGTATIGIGGTTALANEQCGGVWSSAVPGIASIDSNGMVTGEAPGTAVISYTVTTYCGSSTATYNVTVASARPAVAGLHDAAAGLSVFPNPSSGQLSVTTGDAGILVISSVDGTVLANYRIGEGTTPVVMPTGTAAGLYMLHFAGDHGNREVVRLVYNP